MVAEIKDDFDPSDLPEGFTVHGSQKPKAIPGRVWHPVRGGNPYGNKNAITGYRLGPKPGDEDEFFYPPELGEIGSSQSEMITTKDVDEDKLKARRSGLDRRPRRRSNK